ncbi:MAG: hypothetical protein BAJALOKI3v1_10103 [Promethearchaeota archaeon]|nr:MAG: hypothetical protein BAJALOKI3v1_10103 [Candidatus Lokiarchaeota archaeon]
MADTRLFVASIQNHPTIKLEWRGKPYQEVDRFFPSSKLCSVCGYTNEDFFTRS